MTERVALNVRLPKSLHRGLVALAEREYRSLNDQMIAILARAVLDQFDPRRDTIATLVQPFVRACEPLMVVWDRLYPEPTRRPFPVLYGPGAKAMEFDGLTSDQRHAHERMEAAATELIRAFRAWEHACGTPNVDTGTDG